MGSARNSRQFPANLSHRARDGQALIYPSPPNSVASTRFEYVFQAPASKDFPPAILGCHPKSSISIPEPEIWEYQMATSDPRCQRTAVTMCMRLIERGTVLVAVMICTVTAPLHARPVQETRKILMLYAYDPNAPGVVAFAQQLKAVVEEQFHNRVEIYRSTWTPTASRTSTARHSSPATSPRSIRVSDPTPSWPKGRRRCDSPRSG